MSNENGRGRGLPRGVKATDCAAPRGVKATDGAAAGGVRTTDGAAAGALRTCATAHRNLEGPHRRARLTRRLPADRLGSFDCTCKSFRSTSEKSSGRINARKAMRRRRLPHLTTFRRFY
jgi:hypothetical protein